jgi:hypothetical protein
MIASIRLCADSTPASHPRSQGWAAETGARAGRLKQSLTILTVLSQWYEVSNDTLMKRTCKRPLPMRVVSRNHALAFAVAVGIAGVGLLAWKVRRLSLSPPLHDGVLHVTRVAV